MSNFNKSLDEAINIDDEVFLGAVSEKEKKIREQFENYICCKKVNVDSLQIAENESSINDSLYKSLPMEDSKYDSFEDSLNEEVGESPDVPKHVTLRKGFDKLKTKRHALYDSLEDVGSLVSNIDRCSISCGIENDSNVMEKQHIIEDSLKIAPVVIVTNKNTGANEQIHFDEDSLAVAEFENTFDDSLEDINMISSIESIEIEELNDIENIGIGNNVDQKSTIVNRNLFHTVSVIYEKNNFIKADPDESCDSKNKVFDSLSNSECKDAFKDSLEESENDILKINSLNNESASPIMELNSLEKIELDNSVQIVYESIKNLSVTENVSNSECFGMSKDGLNFVENTNSCILHQFMSKIVDMDSSNNLKPAIPEAEKILSEENMLDASVQILYEKNNSPYDESIIFPKYDMSLNHLENINNTSSCFIQQPKDNPNVSSTNYCLLPKCNELYNENVEKLSSASENNLGLSCMKSLQCSSKDDNKYKVQKDNSLLADNCSMPTTDSSNSKKEVITIDACQLKFLNDNMCLDKNLKLQLQIEVTVGDKKCTIESENIKIIPASNSEECEVFALSDSAKSYNEINEEMTPIILEDASVTKVGKKEDKKKEIPLSDVVPSENVLYKANITPRMKYMLCRSSEESDVECNKNEISLLQALDLHDVSLFINESPIQSGDSLLPLNLSFENKPQSSMLRDESKENYPELPSPAAYDNHKHFPCSSHSKESPYKMNEHKTPTNLKGGTGSRENSTKRSGGTKIPVRKINKFAIPVLSAHKTKQTSLSTEKERKCVQSPHSTNLRKNTPISSAHKHHFCKVRNTIFSKVPQIVPCQKYINVQSPVAKYIRNAQDCVIRKTPVLEPILRDCMNDARFHQQMESPFHPHTLPKGGSSKLTNKKM